AGSIIWTNGNPMTFNNNSNGLLTINANISRINEATTRVLNLGGTGDTLMTGSILEPGAVTIGLVTFSKAGQGTITIQGLGSTFVGSTNVNAGTLAVNQIGGAAGGALNGVAGGAL